MATVIIYAQADCPSNIREQIIHLLRNEWPQTFIRNKPEWPTESLELDPISLVLMINGLVVSHGAVLRKSINHCGVSYLAFGLSSVVTSSSFRRQGFGRRIFKYATRYMEQEKADIGIFTCDPYLENFYFSYGWEVAKKTPLVGGTPAKPFSSDRLGKLTLIHFFSWKAKKNRKIILSAPIFLDLGDGKLW
jgi:aminoglycoside 2'-N-acetyltransferase I